MKEGLDIEWKPMKFKEKVEKKLHWANVGTIFETIKKEKNVFERNKIEERFLMFCDKDINVMLQDKKTGKIHKVPFGAIGKGMSMALNIINLEKMKELEAIS